METIRLSESAIAVLRFEIKQWRAKDPGRRLVAYRELAEAGIMEPVPGTDSEYRFTEDGFARREEILRSEEIRIERERQIIPEGVVLSEAARALLCRCASGEEVKVTPENKEAYRELARAQIMFPLSGFVGGPESRFRFTYEGWNRRHEWTALPSGSP
jgi:hypothetical protein